MNIFLWILQVILAWLCLAGGAYQIFKIDELQKGVAAMRAIPHAQWKFLGVSSCILGLCLVVPGVLNVLPVVTPIAATAILIQSVMITIFYVCYRDFSPMIFSIIMAILGGFIAYGRSILV